MKHHPMCLQRFELMSKAEVTEVLAKTSEAKREANRQAKQRDEPKKRQAKQPNKRQAKQETKPRDKQTPERRRPATAIRCDIELCDCVQGSTAGQRALARRLSTIHEILRRLRGLLPGVEFPNPELPDSERTRIRGTSAEDENVASCRGELPGLERTRIRSTPAEDEKTLELIERMGIGRHRA